MKPKSTIAVGDHVEYSLRRGPPLTNLCTCASPQLLLDTYFIVDTQKVVVMTNGEKPRTRHAQVCGKCLKNIPSTGGTSSTA